MQNDQCQLTMSAEDLRTRHPDAWLQARARAQTALRSASDPLALKAHAEHVARTVRQGAAGANTSEMIAARLELLAIKELLQNVASAGPDRRAGAVAGAQPPGVWEARIADRLLFTRDRSRRIPDHRLFNLLWRRLPHHAALTVALQNLGIWWIPSRRLVLGLAELIDGRQTIELGAGDGTLALALETAGVPVTACDDRSWAPRVRCPDWVEAVGAEAALARGGHQVVICCWPPPDNRFEQAVFDSSEVETYIVIAGAIDGVAGSSAAWQRAVTDGGFRRHDRPDLAALVLPAELGCRVMVFERSQRKI